MKTFKVIFTYCYDVTAVVEAESLDEAKQIVDNEPDSLDWVKADEGENYKEDENWEVYNKEEDEWEEAE